MIWIGIGCMYFFLLLCGVLETVSDDAARAGREFKAEMFGLLSIAAGCMAIVTFLGGILWGMIEMGKAN